MDILNAPSIVSLTPQAASILHEEDKKKHGAPHCLVKVAGNKTGTANKQTIKIHCLFGAGGYKHAYYTSLLQCC